MEKRELDSLLRQLQSADLIRLVRGEVEDEFWFKHAATQEAVYGTLLKSTRADLHRRVAEAIERALPEGVADRSAMLALHYERAGVPGRAFAFLSKAGDEARRTYALREAVDFYDRALAMARVPDAGISDEALHAVHAGRGQALQSLADHPGAMESFETMLAAARAGGNPALGADALNRLVTLRILRDGLTPEIVALLDEALRLAQAANDPPLIARTLWNSGLAYRFEDPERGKDYLRRAEALVRPQAEVDENLRELLGYILADLSVAHWATGQLRKTYELLSEAEKIFRDLDHRPMLADTLGGLSARMWAMGRSTEAEALAKEGLELSLAIGNRWAAAYHYFTILPLLLDRGAYEAALATSERALRESRGSSFSAITGNILITTAQLHVALGQVEAGRSAIEQAVESMRGLEAPAWVALGQIGTGFNALARGDPQTAWAFLGPLAEDSPQRERDIMAVLYSAHLIARASLESSHVPEGLQFCDWLLPRIVEEGTQRWEGELRYWCGSLHLQAGDRSAAEANLSRARDLLDAAGATALVWPVDAALADLYAATGRPEQAKEARRRARETVAGLAAAIGNADLRARYLSQPQVARVMAVQGSRDGQE